MDIVIGRIPILPAAGGEWDEAFRRRVQTARRHQGWQGADLCLPTDDSSSRVVLGKWASRVDYDAWTSSPDYLRSAEEMQVLQAGTADTKWYSVIWSEVSRT